MQALRTSILAKMSNITYKQMSLFDAPKDSIIVHAVNCQGVWGSGIAKEFKTRYPDSFVQYALWCKEHTTGEAKIACWPVREQHHVSWIATSQNYGPLKDSVEQIKINTTIALEDLCTQIYSLWRGSVLTVDVYSNRFNSGLFGVKWEDSELILKTVLKRYPEINWIVCEGA